MKKIYSFMCGAAFLCFASPSGAQDFGNPAIEGEWEFTLNGHYLGSYSLNKFTETFEASLDGNTVTFESSGSQYNIVAEFVGEDTLEFTQRSVSNTAATFRLYQSPYVNTTGINDLEDLTEQSFTATFDAAAGKIVFPEGAGLRYGYFNGQTGAFSYWDDAFDFVSSKHSTIVVVGTYSWTIQMADADGIRTQEPVDITVEVTEDEGVYTLTEKGSNFFPSNSIPFTLSDDGKSAVFKYTYMDEMSKTSEVNVWMTAFTYRKPRLVQQNNFEVPFSPESGFVFPADSGLGWFVSTSATAFIYEDFYSAYFITTDEGDTTGVEMAGAEDAPVVYYNLQGIRVDNPSSGIYVCRRGATSTKVLIRD